jgi:hypothetical protein
MNLSRPVVALPKMKRLGNGVVQRAVTRVLAVAGHALSVADVQGVVEERLGQPVSKDSVNSCLSTGARGAKPRFERMAPGCYRLSMPLSARSRSVTC